MRHNITPEINLLSTKDYFRSICFLNANTTINLFNGHGMLYNNQLHDQKLTTLP